MALVLDASAALALHLPDEEASPQLVERLASGEEVVVPGVFAPEVVNSCAVAVRRDRLTSDRARTILAQLEQLEAVVAPARSMTAILEMAQTYGLSAYDATYLLTAHSRGLDLATNDAQLTRAAKKAGVALV
jgi:predicted nucleic acid-binding protein